MDAYKLLDVKNIAALETGIAGILAGFALAIAIMWISMWRTQWLKTSGKDDKYTSSKNAAIIFISAFYMSFLASFLFGMAASGRCEDYELYNWLLAVFSFNFCCIFFSYGLYYIGISLRFIYAIKILRTILNLTILVCFGGFLCVAISTFSQIENIREIVLLKSITGVWFCIVGFLPPAIALIIRRFFNRPEPEDQKIEKFIIVCMFICTIVGALNNPILDPRPYLIKCAKSVFLFTFLFSSLLAWLIAIIPSSSYLIKKWAKEDSSKA